MNIGLLDSIGKFESFWNKISLALQPMQNVILKRRYFISEINYPFVIITLHGVADVLEPDT